MSQSRLPLIIMAIFSILVALVSFRFLALGLNLSFPDMQTHLDARRLYFMMHIGAAPVALAIGAVQFFPKLRAQRPGLHRWLGRIYALSILISGIGGLLLAFYAQGGLISALGFGLLSLIWMVFTAKAIYHAKRREIKDHRRWMIRSFALTFAGVTLRLYLTVAFMIGSDYAGAAAVLSWACWVPNLLVAEVIIKRIGVK